MTTIKNEHIVWGYGGCFVNQSASTHLTINQI